CNNITAKHLNHGMWHRSHSFFTPPFIHCVCCLGCGTTNKSSISITSLLSEVIITIPHKNNRFLFPGRSSRFYHIIYICSYRCSSCQYPVYYSFQKTKLLICA